MLPVLFFFIVLFVIITAIPWANAGAMSLIILLVLGLILGGGGRRA